MEKIYLNHPYTSNFTANITDVIEQNGQFFVILDRTAFYPEGGGQPSDAGLIGELKVSYVYEENDIIYHQVDRKPETLKDVQCSIDWERRFDHMQQHCGQHILSAAFLKILDGATAGFHLGEEYVSVDISIDELKDEDAVKAEDAANEIIQRNLPVKLHYPEIHELESFNLRKQPSVEENIRIVEVSDFDFSPCGGTHPAFTGEIGLIKIRRWEKYKDSIRVEFLCGNRAIKDYRWKNSYVNEISKLLSSKDTEVLENVKKAVADLHGANKDIKNFKDKLLSYEAAELYNNAEILGKVKIIKQMYENREFKELVSLSGKIIKLPHSIALLGLKSQNAQMIFARSEDLNISMNDLFKEVLPLINGKGGGSPKSAQGGGTDISNLESALQSAYLILKNRHIK
ncbi:alanine--tRNA ligase [Oxobacter pfennigii]|uniref:Alanine--tRNA ligase n=1 Tax=Oxobacter pfennigii TaxID=36849 RepID=A0A0P8WU66_9CLOT|nr:DHHA1 domain-containing protein [Oxobacter pfennigii]KPU46243.1 alanine--tRNA ligase [Oxobacter pfennigii]